MTYPRSNRAAAALIVGWLLAASAAPLPVVAAAQQAALPAAAPSPEASTQALWRETEEAAVLAGGLGVRLNKRALREGEPLVVSIEVPRPGYLNVITIGADGVATVLFPNRFDASNRVQAGTVSIPTPRMAFEIKATPPYGRTLVAAFLSQEGLDFHALGEGARDARGVLQAQFARLSPQSRTSLGTLSAKNLAVVPREASLLAGKAEVLVCAATGTCDGGSATAAAAAPPGEVPQLPEALTPGILLEPQDKAFGSEIVTLRAIYDKGLRLTKASEGFVPHLYNDAARYCTIAYGHLIKRQPCDRTEPPDFLDGVSEPEGAALLVKDMTRAQRAVMSLVTARLSDGQYAALCDFTYNVGARNLKSSTLLNAINAGEFHRVPFQLRRWTKAGGREFAGLRTRREREIALFFEGQAVPKAALTGEEQSPLDIRQGEAGS